MTWLRIKQNTRKGEGVNRLTTLQGNNELFVQKEALHSPCRREIQVNDRKRKRAWESEQPLLRPARRLEKRQCMSPTNSGDDAVHRIKEHGSINRPSTRAIDLEVA
ncbi:hypothetical protein GX48_02344 [Paracoccidioides brasiliensis]|nr:hypothetical protein GX48_02344 [Paracoccidioides brasiliensis]